MINLALPQGFDHTSRRLPFFLAMEEWAARNLPRDNYFFSWQVDPTVICGRNQEIDKEVDLKYCRSNGIDVVRRRSGGGAVFADRQNFMFSFITADDNVTEVFARCTRLIVDMLRSLGIDAEASGRNDITIHGHKVSGNAFYHLPGRSIAHGTMLYDFDPAHLAAALTPSRAKLESKGVKSVPMRVTCLKNEGIRLSPAEFEKYAISHITTSVHTLSADDISRIEKIEERYYDPAFMRINARQSAPDSGIVVRRRIIPAVGEFCIEYSLDKKKCFRDFYISGDFFMKADVDTLLSRKMDGVSSDRTTLAEYLDKFKVEELIPGLDSGILLNMITENQNT